MKSWTGMLLEAEQQKTDRSNQRFVMESILELHRTVMDKT